MQPVYANIILQGSIHLSVPVNRNFHMLALNQALQAQLALPLVSQQEMKMGDGSVQVCDIAGPVTVHCLGRQTTCNVLLLPGDTPPYLGSAPLLDLGLTIDPSGKTLVIDDASQRRDKIYL